MLYRLSSLLLAVLVIACGTGCASYQAQYTEERPEAFPAPEGRLTYRTYLVGDAGAVEGDRRAPALRYLEGILPAEDSAATVLFLGNNVYPRGLPSPEHPDRARAERQLDAQARAVANFPGRTIWTPGNFDYRRYGLNGLRRQRDYLRQATGRTAVWAPDVGCGGPEIIEVADDLVYVILDTQWYLSNWRRLEGVNQGCAASNRTEFVRLYREAIKSYREKNIVVVMHHPVYTYGRYGGYFTMKDHLTPVPLIGSVQPFVRGNVGSRQDNLNARFQDLRRQLVRIARVYGNVTFVSGHERNLQYVELNGQRFIVSGSAARATAVAQGDGTLFAYGGLGYATLDHYDDGSSWASFFAVNENGSKAELLYRRRCEAPTAAEGYYPPAKFPDLPPAGQPVMAPLVEGNYDRKPFGRLIFGDHYRSAYDRALPLPALDLETFKGGVRPIKRGGGSQTVTLRLAAEDGREYTMRSLDKNPRATVGVRLSRSSVVQRLVEDGFTAAHPVGALPVTGLAAAAGLNHTNPAVYYVPAQRRLGRYNERFAGKTYLVEERPDDEDWRSYEDFGRPQDIRSTRQALATLREKPDYVIDYRAVTRARLFDLLIGDWDRHDDQWRWVPERRPDGRTHFVPIPRDRDQAFSHYDGLLLGLGRRIVGDISPLRPFRANPRRVAASTRGARFFDATFLAGADRLMMQTEAWSLRAALTDSVIERSFREAWPAELMELHGREIIRKLKGRRDRLPRIAADFYDMRAETVEVAGTDRDNEFRIRLAADGTLGINVYDSRDTEPFFTRTFLPEETEEVILYALEGNDRFSFTGAGGGRIRLRLVGGPGRDSVVYAPGAAPMPVRRARFYDYPASAEYSWLAVEGLMDRRSPQAQYNTYSRLSENKDLDFLRLLPVLGLNPDNGLLIGAVAAWTTYGFKKNPFATRQAINGRYASETGGFRFTYEGEFTDLLGQHELLLSAAAQTSLYGVNFYGFGNETINPEALGEADRDFNRVRQQFLEFAPQIGKRINPAASYAFGPRYFAVETTRTEGRFLALSTDDAQDEGVFSNYQYLGLEGRFTFDNRIPRAMPGRGIRFHVEGGYQFSLLGPGTSFPRLRTELTFNQRIDAYGNLVLASRSGYSQVFTDELAYWQAATLGGAGERPNLRGFRRERFSGDRALWVNNDLRYRFINPRNSELPFSLGALVGYDLGRVWLEGEESDRWHYAYGAGIFISPLDYATLTVNYFVGDGIFGRFGFDVGFFF